MAPWGVGVSLVIGLLVLRNKENQRYPYNMIGLLCVVQSGYIYSKGYAYNSMCGTTFQMILENTLLVKDTWLSNKIGF